MKKDIIKYRGFKIEIKRSGSIYTAANNSGGPFMKIPEFYTRSQAINYNKRNIDQSIDGKKDATRYKTMKKIKCSIGTAERGHATEIFDFSKGWQEEVRSWVKEMGQSGDVLKIWLSSDKHGTFVYSAPNRVLEIP